jgi:hypothetical protein
LASFLFEFYVIKYFYHHKITPFLQIANLRSGLDEWLQNIQLLDRCFYILVGCAIISLVHSWDIYSFDDAEDFLGWNKISALLGLLGYVPEWLETIVSTGLWVFFWLALKKCSSRFSFYQPTLFNLVCVGQVAIGFFLLISELSPEVDDGLGAFFFLIFLAYVVLCIILGGNLLKRKDENKNMHSTGIMLIVNGAFWFLMLFVGIIIAAAEEEMDVPWWLSCIGALLEIWLLSVMSDLLSETYIEKTTKKKRLKKVTGNLKKRSET